MMNGMRGISPMYAASVEIGRNGMSDRPKSVVFGACEWITAPTFGLLRYTAQCNMRSLDGAWGGSPIGFPSRSMRTNISLRSAPLKHELGVIHSSVFAWDTHVYVAARRVMSPWAYISSTVRMTSARTITGDNSIRGLRRLARA